MPLTASGANVLRSMQQEYGTDKGERVFYAMANKKPELGKKWHGKSTSPSASRPLSKR
jgi:hypothetical protein